MFIVLKVKSPKTNDNSNAAMTSTVNGAKNDWKVNPGRQTMSDNNRQKAVQNTGAETGRTGNSA